MFKTTFFLGRWVLFLSLVTFWDYLLFFSLNFAFLSKLTSLKSFSFWFFAIKMKVYWFDYVYLSFLFLYFFKQSRIFILFWVPISDYSQLLFSNILFIHHIYIFTIQLWFLYLYFIAITLLAYLSIFNSRFLASSSIIWIIITSFQFILVSNSIQTILLSYSLSSPIIFQATQLCSAF